MARGARRSPAALRVLGAALASAPSCAALTAAAASGAQAPSRSPARPAGARIVSALVFDPGECRLCAFNGPAAPRLFIDGREDGLGSNFEGILSGMAIARKAGMSFGGVVGGGRVCHGQEVGRLVSELFGVQREHLYQEAIPMLALRVMGLGDLEESRRPGQNASGDVWLRANLPLSGPGAGHIGEFLDHEFLEALRADMLPRLAERSPIAAIRRGHGPVVAMHVRRGDVSQSVNWGRYTKNEFYYDLADRIRAQLPGAEVHAWSETSGSSAPEDFDGFRDRNITVHLDTDIVETWSHMAQAQVLVMAKSSFSFTSAVLNRGCVVYQTYLTSPLQSFTATMPPCTPEALTKRPLQCSPDQTMPVVDQQKLSACLARPGAHAP